MADEEFQRKHPDSWDWGAFYEEQARLQAIRNDPVRQEYDELKRNVFDTQNVFSSLLASLKELHPTREELDALKAGMSAIQQELKSFDRIVWQMNMKADAADSDKWWNEQRDNDLKQRNLSSSIVDQTCAEFARKRVSGGA